jgi:predicted metalloprotease
MGEAAIHRKRSGAEPARRAPRFPARPTRRNPMAEREREVIVTDGGGGGGSGVIIGVVLVIAVVVVLFLLFGRGLLGGGETKDINADIKINTPAKTN